MHAGIQIHHIDGDHWVTSSSIGGEVSLFDSNFRGDPSSFLTHQLAVIYHGLIVREEDGEGDPYLQIHVPAV